MDNWKVLSRKRSFSAFGPPEHRNGTTSCAEHRKRDAHAEQNWRCAEKNPINKNKGRIERLDAQAEPEHCGAEQESKQATANILQCAVTFKGRGVTVVQVSRGQCEKLNWSFEGIWYDWRAHKFGGSSGRQPQHTDVYVGHECCGMMYFPSYMA